MANTKGFEQIHGSVLANDLADNSAIPASKLSQLTAGSIIHPGAVEEIGDLPSDPQAARDSVTKPAKQLYNAATTATAAPAVKPAGSGRKTKPPPPFSDPDPHRRLHLWMILLILLVAAALAALIYGAASDLSKLSKRQKDHEHELQQLKGGDTNLDLKVDQLTQEITLLQGEAGNQGTQGTVGPSGAQGTGGATGLQGSTGDTGATGPQGLPGSNDCIAGVCVSRQATSPGVAETGNINITGTAIAGSFSGSGASLTGINASNISSGTLADGRLSTNVTLQGNTFNGASQLVQTTAGGLLPALDASNLTNLNASNLASGTVNTARISGSYTGITGTGALNSGSITSGFGSIDVGADAITTTGTVTGGTVNATTGLNTGAGAGTQRIDASGNLVNIGNLTGTGAITIASAGAGNDVIIDGADAFIVQDAATFNAVITATTLGTTNTDAVLCRNAANQLASCNSTFTTSATAFIQGGNSFIAPAILGTNDSNSLSFETNNATQATIAVGGATTFKNSANSTAAFQIQNAASGELFRVDSSNSNLTLGGLNSGELQAWTADGDALPDSRGNGATVTANGYVYYIGGVNGSSVPQATVYYAKLNADGSTGAWATNANALPAARYALTAVAANGYVYVIGGCQISNCTVQSTVYYAKLNTDGSTGAWNTTTALPAARASHTSITANGYVYVIGGLSVGDLIAQSTVYYAKLNADGTVGTWNTTTVLSSARHSHSSVAANGYVYVVGGVDSVGGFTATVYYAKLNLDGTVGAWTLDADALPGNRNAHASAVANGNLYVLGGCSVGCGATATVYYAALNGDGSIGAFATGANSLPAGHAVLTSMVANGYFYIIGGGGGGATTTVYYSSTARIKLGGSLDLVGLGGENLAEGGTGGSLTAGNTSIVGDFNVQGNATFAQGVSVDKDFVTRGSALFKNATDSATGFQVQNAAGTPLLVADATNTRIYIGNPTADATGTLLVLDTKNTSGDPTGVNGGMYYNSNTGRFRCFQNSIWTDCIPSPEVWTTYTCNWYVLAGTAPAIGNGTLACRYIQTGKTVHFNVYLKGGSTTAWGSANNQWFFSLPANMADPPAFGSGTVLAQGNWYAFDATVAEYGGFCFLKSDGGLGAATQCVGQTTTAQYTSKTANDAPFTWGTSDQLVISGTYQAN